MIENEQALYKYEINNRLSFRLLKSKNLGGEQDCSISKATEMEKEFAAKRFVSRFFR
jgi:hypothetical protein